MEEKIMKLNIQMFAEENPDGQGEEQNEGIKTTDDGNNKVPTFTELLKNPEYQREFDKLVNKSLETAKGNWQKDYDAKLEAEKTEAQKLAKMDAEQKAQYELEKEKKLREEAEGKLNAMELYKTASNIATEKELPIGYLDLIDFTKETADTVSAKLDKIAELRAKDLDAYLKDKLKEPSPKQKQKQSEYDPYIEGFRSEYK